MNTLRAGRLIDIYRNGAYASQNPGWHAADAPWKAAKVRAILQRNRIDPASICDIGCGTGDVLRELRRNFPRAALSGRDISPDALAMGSGDMALSEGSVDGAPRSEVALALDVFEHVDDYPAFLRQMVRIADTQVYHVPLDISLMAIFRGSLERNRVEIGHIHIFTAETALAALREAGHKVQDVIFTNGAAEQPRSLKQRIAAGPRLLGLAVAPRLASKIMDGYSMMVLCHQ